MIDFSSSEVQFALKAVRQGAEIAQCIQQKGCTALKKSDSSPVTLADYSIQAYIGKLLTETFPGIPLVAEESSKHLFSTGNEAILPEIEMVLSPLIGRASKENILKWIDRGTEEPADMFWTLDPIDGTKGFLRREQYVVALALIKKGKVEMGVLACPNLNSTENPDPKHAGVLILAQRGKGCWLQPLPYPNSDWKKVHVSACDDPHNAKLVHSFEKVHIEEELMEQAKQILGIQLPVLAMDSMAKHACVAMGLGDFLIQFVPSRHPNHKIYIWDQAPGGILIEEAGGKVTDLDGKDLDFGQGRRLSANRGIILSNKILHPAALKAVAQIPQP